MTSPATGPLDKYSAAELATLTAEAEGWKPDDGDELQGIVLAVKVAINEQNGNNYPIVFVLDDKEGKAVAVHGFQTILQNELKSQRPLPGEAIYIKRIGEGVSKKAGQSPPIKYAVHVSREAGAGSDPWQNL